MPFNYYKHIQIAEDSDQSIPTPQPRTGGQEYNIGSDFSQFEKTIAASTENSKNAFVTKLYSMVGNKKVLFRGSKGYRQPEKDYIINVKTVSVDFYYERYVVVFKDDKDKDYFLKPGFKIKILGKADPKPITKKKKKSVSPNQPLVQYPPKTPPAPTQQNVPTQLNDPNEQ